MNIVLHWEHILHLSLSEGQYIAKTKGELRGSGNWRRKGVEIRRSSEKRYEGVGGNSGWGKESSSVQVKWNFLDEVTHQLHEV